MPIQTPTAPPGRRCRRLARAALYPAMPQLRNDLTIYDTHAADWWAPRSPFSCSLQAGNRLCLAEILQATGEDLHDLTVVDLGCGGGLLAQPLAARGAR